MDVHGTCSAGASALVSLRSRLETLVERLEASWCFPLNCSSITVLKNDMFSGVWIGWWKKQGCCFGKKNMLFFDLEVFLKVHQQSTCDFGIQSLPRKNGRKNLPMWNRPLRCHLPKIWCGCLREDTACKIPGSPKVHIIWVVPFTSRMTLYTFFSRESRSKPSSCH